MSDTKHVFVRFKARPRPDHPTEDRPIVLRADTIMCITREPFNYTPDDKAPVAVLPNAKILKGEATVVTTVMGAQFWVDGTIEEVLQKIKDAYSGTPYTLPMGVAA